MSVSFGLASEWCTCVWAFANEVFFFCRGSPGAGLQRYFCRSVARSYSQAGCQGPLRLQRRDVGALAAGEALYFAGRPGSVEDELHRDGSLNEFREFSGAALIT
jgi:hypothetical protein